MDKYYPFYLSAIQDIAEIKSQLIDDGNIIAFFDSRNIICEEQVKVALYRANRSFKSNKSIAKQFNIELMLHLAGTHQIKIGLDLFDLKPNTKEIVLIHLTGEFNLPNSNQGFPLFSPNKEIFDKMGIKNQKYACKEIISLGARLVTDYE
ncbi:MAG: hypothetical protein GPJ54_17275 [Candidatus Heimdallarchaeota archaeon]|nr:hypothetical protein [Candidatus Heimdallarchaeota archaeon]